MEPWHDRDRTPDLPHSTAPPRVNIISLPFIYHISIVYWNKKKNVPFCINIIYSNRESVNLARKPCFWQLPDCPHLINMGSDLYRTKVDLVNQGQGHDCGRSTKIQSTQKPHRAPKKPLSLKIIQHTKQNWGNF